MNTQGLNKSVLALLIATSANGVKAATTTSAADVNSPKKNNPAAPTIYYYGLFAPARYKHETKGFIEGQILLNITETKITPPNLNKITAEYEGEFYFISNQNVGTAKVFESLGGDDGKIILDLVNQPSQEHSALPATYNMHGCSSTLSACSPLAVQINVYRNGNIAVSGILNSNVEILDNGQWTNSISNISLLPVSSSK